MTLTRTQLALMTTAAVLLLAVVFVMGRGCATDSSVLVILPAGIDAGPGEEIIANRLDGAVQAGQLRIEQIEEKFDEDMAAFDAQQRADYERMREGTPEEAASYLSAWSQRRRDAGT